MALYHKEVGFPKCYKKQSGTIRLKYSNHAIKASKNDRYGKINLPQSINLDNTDMIEAEFNSNGFEKAVLRMAYNQDYDICLVVIPKEHLVKTVWLNAKTDNHKTLDRSKYSLPA